MENKLEMGLVFLAVAGLYLLGNSITGNVISETCCFPPDCPLEDMCEEARPELESPAQLSKDSSFYAGIILLASSVVAYLMTKRKL